MTDVAESSHLSGSKKEVRSALARQETLLSALEAAERRVASLEQRMLHSGAARLVFCGTGSSVGIPRLQCLTSVSK